MRERYVVDTNVLIAASAADPVAPVDIDATPDDPGFRLQVWQWLCDFQEGDSRLVLDDALRIFSEYGNKLGFNDYGIQVVMHKWSTCAVDSVQVEYDEDGNGVLPASIASIIHDLADRKMVAAALACNSSYGESCVAFAGDTDWHEWEDGLKLHNVDLEPIIESWSREKYREKMRRQGRC